jgi:hypothetical protein
VAAATAARAGWATAAGRAVRRSAATPILGPASSAAPTVGSPATVRGPSPAAGAGTVGPSTPMTLMPPVQ